MPGYFIHLASAPEDVRSSTLGLKGLIAPDLWKKHTPTENEYIQFFDKCPDAPSYEQVKFLCSIEHGGSHFGSEPGDTNHADFAFISTLFARNQFDKTNPFFKGYIHHLRVDKNFYADDSICDGETFDKDFTVDRKNAMTILHLDWDKTNFAISKWFPEVVEIVSTMPDEVQKVIGFTEGKTKYVALDPMKHFIEDMRKPRSIDELLKG